MISSWPQSQSHVSTLSVSQVDHSLMHLHQLSLSNSWPQSHVSTPVVIVIHVQLTTISSSDYLHQMIPSWPHLSLMYLQQLSLPYSWPQSHPQDTCTRWSPVDHSLSLTYLTSFHTVDHSLILRLLAPADLQLTTVSVSCIFIQLTTVLGYLHQSISVDQSQSQATCTSRYQLTTVSVSGYLHQSVSVSVDHSLSLRLLAPVDISWPQSQSQATCTSRYPVD